MCPVPLLTTLGKYYAGARGYGRHDALKSQSPIRPMPWHSSVAFDRFQQLAQRLLYVGR